jgi:hypothetical protein
MSTQESGSRLRVIVTGLLAQYPLGGVAWDYLQYPVGLARAGHDIYYIEDTGQWPFNPSEAGVSKTCDANVAHLEQLMTRFGLADRWAYRFAWEGQWFGLSESRRNEVMATADLFINVSGVWRDPVALRDDTRATMVFIDSDPVFTQIKLARGDAHFQRSVDAHDVHFSFGESHSAGVPETGHEWLPTRQPVLLDQWEHHRPDQGSYTTVMNWTSYNDVEYQGVTYGQKNVEFSRFMELPTRTTARFEIAMAEGKNARPPVDLLRHRGWSIVDPSQVCPDIDSYRSYLQTSRGEWSVAKNGYVAGGSGWFSCRSACYLAAGRPVVAQETGFSAVLPVGEGLFAFSSIDEAVDAIDQIESDYERHARAAREIAEGYFDSQDVLGSLIERSLAGGPSSTDSSREASS